MKYHMHNPTARRRVQKILLIVSAIIIVGVLVSGFLMLGSYYFCVIVFVFVLISFVAL